MSCQSWIRDGLFRNSTGILDRDLVPKPCEYAWGTNPSNYFTSHGMSFYSIPEISRCSIYAGNRAYAHNSACWTRSECEESEHGQNGNHEYHPAPAKTCDAWSWYRLHQFQGECAGWYWGRWERSWLGKASVSGWCNSLILEIRRKGLHKVCGGCLLDRLHMGCPLSFVQSILEVHLVDFSLTFNSN